MATRSVRPGQWQMQPAPMLGRFWEKVDTTGDCWEWRGARNGGGYGSFQIGAPSRQTMLAHRLSWELHNGPIPVGLCVLHRCDNRPCVNPAHLFLGTYLDNVHDMRDKGRLVNPTADAYRARTHCKHGHEYTPENIRMYHGARQCRECFRVWSRARSQRRVGQ